MCRICRPGCIVGPQQQFLHVLEKRMRREGDLYRRRLQKQLQHRDSGAAPHAQEDRMKSSWSLFAPIRRPQRKQQHYALTDSRFSGSSNSHGHRATSSPMLTRRWQSTEVSRGLGIQRGGGGGGSGGGGRSFMQKIGGQQEPTSQARTGDRTGSKPSTPWLIGGINRGDSGAAQGHGERERRGSRESHFHCHRRATSPPGRAVDTRILEGVTGAGRRGTSGWATLVGGARESGAASSDGSEFGAARGLPGDA